MRCVANSAYLVEMIVNLDVFLSLRLLVLTIRQPFSKLATIERALNTHRSRAQLTATRKMPELSVMSVAALVSRMILLVDRAGFHQGHIEAAFSNRSSERFHQL